MTFEQFFTFISPYAILLLGGVVGYILKELNDIRKAHANDIVRLASETVGRREFDQFEKRFTKIEEAILRIHERLDELFKELKK
jgi:hypothetical protein